MSILKRTYDKDLYDKIAKFYNTYNTYNALVKFKGSDKEYIIQSIKTADPRWVFCTINGLGQFCKDITKITFLNRKAVDYFANIKEGIDEPHDAVSNPEVKLKQAIVQRYKELTLANREGSSIYKTLEKEFGNQIPLENIVSLVSNIKIREQKLNENYSPEQVKDLLWGHFKDKASNIIFKGQEGSTLVFEVHVENNMTWDEMNELFGELEESDFFDCVLQGDNKTLTVKYLGPIKNSIMEKSKKAIDQAILETKLVSKLKELTGKEIRLIENTFGTPANPFLLQSNKIYVWTGGAELLDIKFIGKTKDFPNIQAGTSVGKGLLFQWIHDGKYLELSSNAVRQDVIEKEESQINEATSTGEYSIEEMDKFVQALLSIIPWGEGPTINIPSNWPANTVCSDKHSIVDVWEKAKQKYPNAKWYVWKADLSGNKPIQLASQKLDINNILQIVSEHPEAYKSLSIGVDNEQTDRFAKDLSTQGD